MLNRRDCLLAAAAGLLVAGVPRLAGAQSLAETDAPKVPAPKGATVLLNGSDLSAWVNRKDGQPAGWTRGDGWIEVNPGTGDIITQERFQDYRLHVEFWLPYMPEASGQARANSGVYNQGRLEVQVLDSYGQPPRDNEAGGIYQVAVPLRNGSKKPAHWQTYDIVYRAPRFGPDGKQTEKGRISVRHNGLVIHHNVAFDARTTTSGLPPENKDYSKPGPILLQDHGNKVRYRNIWIVPM